MTENAESAEKKEEKKRTKEKWSLKEAFLRMDREQWIVILLFGVLLAVISMPVEHKNMFQGSSDGLDKKESAAQTSKTQSLRTDTTGILAGSTGISDSAEAEKSALERKLETLLTSVEGIGRTQVLLMTQETYGDSFYGNANTIVTGVLISAEGADDPVTIQNIKEAIIALFQIEAHKIKVMKMK